MMKSIIIAILFASTVIVGLPMITHFWYLSSSGPYAASIKAVIVFQIVSFIFLMIGASVGLFVVVKRFPKWKVIVVLFGTPVLLILSLIFYNDMYTGEYKEEYEVESLSWRLSKLPLLDRQRAPEKYALETILRTTTDEECRIDVSGNLSRLGLAKK
ncbi:MAG TPA: hypothetical protein VHQ47_18105 [Phycisphaerae bacterium]|nr:hypothetical protein [Phycisphaerae bacterium]